MLDKTYLIRGLDTLCRAHETSYFADGHRGAAIISAHYLCHENKVEKGVPDILAAMIDEHWTHTDLCAPFATEPSQPELLETVRATFLANIAGLRQVGHNVIFPSLALKVFRELPETVTPARVAGLCKLIEAFTIVDDLEVTEDDDIPYLGSPQEAAELILAELLQVMTAFIDRGQGWSGHLLTYGRALLDLREAGHDDLAGAAEPAFRIYLKRIRMGPDKDGKAFTEHPDIPLRPHQRAYWERRQAGSPALGHLFKYPYGFYGLMNLAQDPALKEQCMRDTFRIF
jgi:hypothetical protein